MTNENKSPNSLEDGNLQLLPCQRQDDCRVLDVRTDKPIPHLYAAGEATGMVHGAVRLGSVAILDCLVFGRICGQKVAAEK